MAGFQRPMIERRERTKSTTTYSPEACRGGEECAAAVDLGHLLDEPMSQEFCARA
jgi:hypothetical protein